MNILHMKYALEVAKTGSLNRAAEKLFVAQPNLSRAIKELEQELGIKIFDRSAKGMRLTGDGEEFIRHARSITHRIDEIEQIYKHRTAPQAKFSLCSLKAGYVAEAFVQVASELDKRTTEAIYYETNSNRVLSSILEFDYKLGVVRCAAAHEKFYKSLFASKGLAYMPLAEISYVLVMNKNCPLAQKEHIKLQDLADYAEIVHGDPLNPNESLSVGKIENLPTYVRREFRVFDRSIQLAMLGRYTTCFMWASCLPKSFADRYDLTWRKCDDVEDGYRDFLIYRQNYQLTEADQLFLKYLKQSKNSMMG